jgi:DNA replication protein DnaC
MEFAHQLTDDLKRLRLPGISENLQLRVAEAQDHRLGYLEFLSLLIQDEMLSREANTVAKYLRAAGFPEECTFEGFDFTFNHEVLPTALVRDLATCHFVRKHRNLLIAGPPGIGKSFIAIAIGHEMCRRTAAVLFRKTSTLLNKILDTSNRRRSERLLKTALSVDLLILDDFALQRYSQEQTEILYLLADGRLGKGSIILTSNRPPEEWYAVFPDPVVGGAILDRLISSAIKLITTEGRSYRKERLGTYNFAVDEPITKEV